MSATSEPGAPTHRLVFLHGFTQTHHHWHHCADLIADRLPAPPDARLRRPSRSRAQRSTTRPRSTRPVHRSSSSPGRAPTSATRWVAGSRSTAALARCGHRRTTGADRCDTGHRGRRRTARTSPPRPTERADRIEAIGVEAFLDEWLAAPMFADLAAEPSTPRAPPPEHGDRPGATACAWCGTGNQAPLWQQLGGIAIPVLVIAGERDPKFTEIGQQMSEALPDGHVRRDRRRRTRRPHRTARRRPPT